ncbi:nucleotide sugar dehydrogenase [Prochlorococcus sp. AH-716-E17]|nr:nucleotide sugar dehydrogenase [Prochlorococcus sp. AH-716-E17]
MKSCCVIGLGYIGLPTAAVIAKSNICVKGYDINENRVKLINKGHIDFKEPGLESLLEELITSKKFKAFRKLIPSDIYIIAVPTPLVNSGSRLPEPDISYILGAAEDIAKEIKKDDLVIIESTSPVGTTEKIASLISNISGIDKKLLNFAYCPERAIPGNTLNELVNNDRVIGGLNKRSTALSKEFYKNFSKGQILETNSQTAELIKLTENAYRDVNIAFANEMSIICDNLNVDVFELIKLANRHPRVDILKPGCGVGGHCISVDPWFIASRLPSQTPLIQTSRNVNNQKTEWSISKIKNTMKEFEKENSHRPNVGLLGLTFKPDINDIRESPAIKIATYFSKNYLGILISDPYIDYFKGLDLMSYKDVIKESDIVVILVAHKEFKSFDYMGKQIIDLCGIFA